MNEQRLRLPYKDAQGLEPSVLGHDMDPNAEHDISELHIQFSQAVSLKRIADALTGQGDFHALHGTVTNMAWEAGRSFAAGQRTDR